jgi:hypothetical protein
MAQSKIINIKNSGYYAARRVDDWQIITIIGAMPKGLSSPGQTVIVSAQKNFARGGWEAVTVNWASLGSQSLKVTKDFVTMMQWASKEAARIEALILRQKAENSKA